MASVFMARALLLRARIPLWCSRVVAATNCLLVCELHDYGDQSLISHVASAQCSAWCTVLLREKGINEEGMRWMQNLVSLMTPERTF